ncbi:MAG: class I SAM-dependent methyltransferase [Patescibacteria group bacterium]
MKKTSWGDFAGWYNDLIEKEKNTYQKELILPNLLRLLAIKKNDVILDIACGQGFFPREFAKLGAKIIGVDISQELIDIAKKKSSSITYYVSLAENMPFLTGSSIDKITIILSIQNIENANDVFKECNRVLNSQGQMYLILNHPAFRIPKETSWGWDGKRKIQYRRIDSYLSESKAKIQMHPGSSPNEFSWSFHRPMQFYSKALLKNNFCISRIEEWNSHKKSEPGPRAIAEDRARREIPLFLFIEAKRSNC